jgi:Tfp pilus assembly protein PilE
MSWLKARRRDGFAMVELLAVAGVIALLLALGIMAHRSMRAMARVSVAESNLKQTSTALELYFRQFNSYPPQGSNLAAELAPFVENPEIFNNPLLEETTPGETISRLYRQPSLEEIDSPDHYVTALISEDGQTAVILNTGSLVDRRNDLQFDPSAPGGDIAAILDPDGDAPSDDGEPVSTSSGDSEPAPPEDPPADGSPDDHSEEVCEGTIKAKNCSDVLFQVVATNLTASGLDTPVTVEGKFGQAVTYVVVQDGVTRVKFEDAEEGSLGEDGAQETDRFVMTVTGTTDSVSVTTKAGQSETTTTFNDPQPGDTQSDSLGFEITIENVEGGQTTDGSSTWLGEVVSESCTYTVSVTSVEADNGLSHVEFDFGDGTEVTVEDMTRYAGLPMFGGLDVDGGEHETRTLKAGESFGLIGIADFSDWITTYASDVDLTQVFTFRNGDVVPENVQLATYVFEQELVDPTTRVVTIADNQVLFLFELGVTDPAYFDCDDLVMIVTLNSAANAAECE